MSLSRAAAIAGIGETEYVRRSSRTADELQFAASLSAIDDAGLDPGDIDGVIPVGITGAPAEEYVTNLGLRDLRFSALIPHGGASGIGALQCAAAAVAAGIATAVLVPAGRNVSSGARRRSHSPDAAVQTGYRVRATRSAFAPAQLYAPMARQYVQRYSVTSEQFGEIAVACRQHAILNGNAIMTKPITQADHQARG